MKTIAIFSYARCRAPLKAVFSYARCRAPLKAVYFARCRAPLKAVLLSMLFVSSAAFAGPKLYVIDCGTLTVGDVTTFDLKPEETPVRELFVPCYLVRHAKGTLLFDTGLPLSMVGKGVVSQDGGSMVYERSIVDQLAAMDLKPAQLTYVAFSHLHFDHAGGANAFVEANVLMQKAEWDAAWGANPGFSDTTLFDKLKGGKLEMIEGDHDVFGDGSVKLISAPGHTPGHQTLLIDLEKNGPIMLSGDLYHFRVSRELRRAPKFNSDAAMTFRSMDKVEALIKETGATLWIEHDKELADTLKKAPEFYE